MPAIKFDTTLMRLIKDMQEVRAALRHVTTNLPLYDVANENTPASISADQNNYVPGNYDVLRLASSSNITITGIANGKRGRFLTIFNVGANKITLPHQSALSLAQNRFDIVGDENIVLFPTASINMYYDETTSRWLIQDRPKWLGTYGVSFRGYKTSDSIGDVGSVGEVQITNVTVATDEWGMWDGNQITIPQTGIYNGAFSGWFSANATGWRKIGVELDGTFIVSLMVDAVSTPGYGTYLAVPISWTFNAGGVLKFFASQNSGGARDLNNINMALSRVF